MAELGRAVPDIHFNLQFEKLIDSLECHIAEEEGQLFPLAETLFSEDELEDLGTEMQAARVVSVKVAA
jgi:hemerythrin-like domain-containing protein